MLLLSSVPSFWTSLSPSGLLFRPKHDWRWDPLVQTTSKWVFSVCQQITIKGDDKHPLLIQIIISNIFYTSAFVFLFNLSSIIRAKKELLWLVFVCLGTNCWNRSNQSFSLKSFFWKYLCQLPQRATYNYNRHKY